MDVIDCPRRSVTDHLAPIGHQPTVVVTSGDLVAATNAVWAGADVWGCFVDVAHVDALLLASLVESFDGLVVRRHQQHGVAVGAVLPPPPDGGALHLCRRAAV